MLKPSAVKSSQFSLHNVFFLSQVKAAFTRTYNKEVHLTPYSLQVVKKGRRGGGGESELAGEDGENVVQESEEEEDGLQKDAMIKVGPPAWCQPTGSLWPPSFLCVNLVGSHLQQKKSKATKESKKEVKEDSGKGKGKGKGKGTGRGGSKGAGRGK